MSFFYPSSDISYYDEYRKAALLAGHNHQIFYEVGKIYLSRWPEISEKDKDFTFDILRKIASAKEREKLQNLMQIWDLNVKDYAVMEKILPEDATVYRFYARFLGEKSLSLEKRQEMLARAEFMEFERAKKEYHAGENDFLYFRLKEALAHFKSCVNALDRINFYQSLVHQTLIGSSEFIELRKSTMLNLAKCQIEMGRMLEEVEGDLRLYLNLEDEVAEVGKLELYLRSRELIEEKLETSLDDLNRLSFHILLSFKQNRYRDIMRIGNILRESFLVVPEAQKNAYVNILLLIGDSFQKVDYIYDALEFYEKALEIEPDNLKTLLRIRQNHERMNEEENIRETDKKIEKLMAPRERMFINLLINKGQKYLQVLNLDGREIILSLHFKDGREIDIIPLICIFFNGKVVWESYLKSEGEKVEAAEESESSGEADKIVSLSLKSNIGKNILIVMPVDRPVNLLKITYR
jgi:tetratricopeptide (TPR) repeat protein